MNNFQLITLILTPGMKKSDILRIFNSTDETPLTFQDIADLFKRENASFVPTVPELERQKQKAAILMEKAANMDLTILNTKSNHYPAALKNIKNTPFFLFVKGNPKTLANNDRAAIVGTRTPSSFGVNASRSIATHLSKEGITVVSGLAKGCDTNAHMGCLNAFGKTVAVIANWKCLSSPQGANPLIADIIEKDGCIVCEHPPGIKVLKKQFVARNRIISGISKSVFIVETKLQSGTMHTVNFARTQQKNICCVQVPSKYKCVSNAGNDALLKQSFVTRINSKETLMSHINDVYKDDLPNFRVGW